MRYSVVYYFCIFKIYEDIAKVKISIYLLNQNCQFLRHEEGLYIHIRSGIYDFRCLSWNTAITVFMKTCHMDRRRYKGH